MAPKICITLSLLLLLLNGCTKSPSDSIIKSAVADDWQHVMKSYYPLAMKIEAFEIEIKEKGRFHDKEKFLLVKARIKGNFRMGNYLEPFDSVDEYKVYQDDYGKWLAKWLGKTQQN